MNQSSWTTEKLGKYFRIKHGYAFKGEFFAEQGSHVLLTPGNFKEDGGLKLKGEKEKYYSGPVPDEFVLKCRDLLVAMTDLKQVAPILGSAAFIPKSDFFLHNQRLGKIVELDERELSKEFLYYLFNSPKVRAQIKGSATGTTVRHTAPERIYNVVVDLPPIKIQQKIARILSAYDELIENNTWRIEILEEMAQALYREWFVNFRFPGHEEFKLIASVLGRIPHGWEIKKLGEIANVNASSIKPGNGLKEIDYVDISSVTVGRIGNVERYALADAPGRARRIVRNGDIIWSCVRPNRKSYALILNPKPNLIVSTGFAVISAIHAPHTYLYHALTMDDFVGYLTNRARGAAYPAVTAEDFINASILLPPKKLLDQFHDIASSHFDLIHDLHQTNTNLRRARDLLLPKLIAGEVG